MRSKPFVALLGLCAVIAAFAGNAAAQRTTTPPIMPGTPGTEAVNVPFCSSTHTGIVMARSSTRIILLEERPEPKSELTPGCANDSWSSGNRGEAPAVLGGRGSCRAGVVAGYRVHQLATETSPE